MSATGTFEIQLEPQKDEIAPVGRMIMHKQYTGDLVGVGMGQMISKRTEKGAAAYSAIEEFVGTVSGKKGAFTLIHTGYMSADTQSLQVKILEGSGTEALQDIKGELVITQKNGGHSYEFIYQLP